MDVVVIIPEDHPTLLSLLQLEAGGGCGLLDRPDERLAAGEGEYLVGTVGGEQPGTQQLETSGPGAVLEPRHERHLHGDFAAGAAKFPVDLRMGAGRTAIFGDRHEIGDADRTGISLEGSFQYVGAREVSLARRPAPFRTDRPGAAALGIEQRGKDAA